MLEPPIVPLSGKTNVAIVCESLEEIIKSGFWKPDDKLPTEAELCVKYNVGRSTIREAINMLKARGILRSVSGQGTFVNKPSDNMMLATQKLDPESEMDLLNIMELRLSLEPMNAAFAARRASEEQICEMRHCDEILKQVVQGESKEFAQNDLAYHMLIAKATGNPILEGVMETVHTFFLEQQILTSQVETRRVTALDFHTRLTDAIEAGDERLAENIMRSHMDDTYIYVKSLISIPGKPSVRQVSRKASAKKTPGK